MTYEKPSNTPPTSGLSFGRIGRVVAFFATAGFAYPNVFVENIDIAKIDAKIDAKNKIKTETL